MTRLNSPRSCFAQPFGHAGLQPKEDRPCARHPTRAVPAPPQRAGRRWRRPGWDSWGTMEFDNGAGIPLSAAEIAEEGRRLVRLAKAEGGGRQACTGRAGGPAAGRIAAGGQPVMSDAREIRLPRPASSGISCIGWHSVSGSGPLRGFADLHIAAFRLRLFGCAAFAGGASEWVALPTKPILGRDGQPLRHEDTGKLRYEPVIAFDDQGELRLFSRLAVEAIERYAPGAFGGAR